VVSSTASSALQTSHYANPFRYLANNLDWLDEQLGAFDNDYLLIDLPGQIELYTHHHTILPPILNHIRTTHDYRICATYLLESQFVLQPEKFFAGALSAMSAMIMLECSHINILSKADLVKGEIGRGQLKRFLEGDGSVYEETKGMNPGRHRLNEAIVRLVEDFGMVNMLPLDSGDRESVETILSYIDDCTQWAEDQVPSRAFNDIDGVRNQRNRQSLIRILIWMIIMTRFGDIRSLGFVKSTEC
jgi:GPN-loop GTPase